MDLQKFLHEVMKSDVKDWEMSNRPDDCTPTRCEQYFVYKNDIDISMAWIGEFSERSPFDWELKLLDERSKGSKVKCEAVLFRYRGAVVYRWEGVKVGDYFLPTPQGDGHGGHQLPQLELRIARLVFTLHAGEREKLDDVLERAGINID